MRFLHISALPVWPLEGKGGMPSLRETLRGHVDNGHEVVLLLPQYNILGDEANLVPVRKDEGYEVHLMPCNWAPKMAYARRRARGLGKNSELPYPLRWMLNLLLCFLLTCSLLLAFFKLRSQGNRDFDLVYAHNQYAALAGWVIGKIMGAPNVTRLYGTFLADLMEKPLVWLRYPSAAAGFLIPHSLLICANDGTRGDQVAAKLGIDLRRFRFWQNGVDLPQKIVKISRERFKNKISSKKLRLESHWIVSCSRLSYWKRIDRMVRAVAYARSKECDCQLVIAGDGPERGRLSDMGVELGIEDDLIFLGAVQHDEIWELMNVADLFMITNDVTNRCNPLFEAICAGLPVISVYDQSTGDLLEHGKGALLSHKNDIEGMGKNIEQICKKSGMSDKFRAAQQTRASEFWSWSERMKTEVRELEKLVTGVRSE